MMKLSPDCVWLSSERLITGLVGVLTSLMSSGNAHSMGVEDVNRKAHDGVEEFKYISWKKAPTVCSFSKRGFMTSFAGVMKAMMSKDCAHCNDVEHL